MYDAAFYVKGTQKETLNNYFSPGKEMIILFDSTTGNIKYLENETERVSLDLGNDFINKDLFLTVCFHRKQNKVQIIDPNENQNHNSKKNQLDIQKLSQILNLKDKKLLHLLKEIQKEVITKDQNMKLKF